MSLILIGDIHLKKEEPYLSGNKKIFQWLLDNYKDNDFLFLGDIYDSSSPHWDVVEEFLYFVRRINGKVYVFSGNHDKSYMKGNALKSLSGINGVELIFKKEIISFQDNTILILPHITNMKEYEDLEGTYDYIVCHGTPQEEAWKDEGITFTKLKGTVIWGHIHRSREYDNHNKNYIVGTLQCTRNLEQLSEHRILSIDEKGIQSIPVPTYMTIEDIKYGEEPKSKDNLLNVEEAPSEPAVFDRYPAKEGYYIRKDGIQLLEKDGVEMDVVKEIKKLKSSLEIQYTEYADKKGVDKERVATTLKYFEMVPEDQVPV